MDFLSNAFSSAQAWLFETLLPPALFTLGLGHLLVAVAFPAPRAASDDDVERQP